MIYERVITGIVCRHCKMKTDFDLKLFIIGREVCMQGICRVCHHSSIRDPFQFLSLCMNFGHLDFNRFISDHKEYEQAAQRHYSDNPWIQKYMDAMGWMWICICNGDVVGGSAKMQEFPTEEEKHEIGHKYHGIPFCYSQPIVSESLGIGT